MSDSAPRWGRNAPPPPSTAEQIAKTADEIKDSIGETASAAAQKTGEAFSAAADQVGETVTAAKRSAVRAFLTHKATLMAGAAAVAFAGAGIWMSSQFTAEAYLESLDPAFRNKCYSLHKRHDLTSEPMRRNMEKSFELMRGFGTRGNATADRLAKSGYTFCFGIDNAKVFPKAHWDGYDIFFVNSNYPIEMAAAYMASEDKTAFWSSKVAASFNINRYVPESGLVFSRAQNAMSAVEDVRNLYRALGDGRWERNSSTLYEWQEFLKENPTLEKTVNAYLASMAEHYNEAAAMESATLAFMQDAAAVQAGDAKHLSEYNHHVKIVSDSSHTYIYEESTGFFSRNREFALVDADRDGRRDDLIEIDTYNNRAIRYRYDYGTSDWDLRNKRESYDCSTTDDKGNSIPQTCYRDAEEWVYYDKIPAAETASVRLDPQTLVDMAKLTETDFLSPDTASKMARDFAFSQTYGANIALMDTIKRNQEANIPAGRDTGQTAPGLGLR